MAIGEIERYREVLMTSSEGVYYLLTSVIGVKAKYAPLHHPVVIKGIAVQSLTTVAYTSAPIITIWKNTSPGLTGTGNYSSIDTLTLATGSSDDTGQVFYSSPSLAVGSTSQTYIRPGEEVLLDVSTSTSTASQSHAIRATLFIEPWYENPGNNSNMTAV